MLPRVSSESGPGGSLGQHSRSSSSSSINSLNSRGEVMPRMQPPPVEPDCPFVQGEVLPTTIMETNRLQMGNRQPSSHENVAITYFGVDDEEDEPNAD